MKGKNEKFVEKFLFNGGSAYRDKKKLNELLTYCNQALKLNPHNPNYYALRATIYCLQSGKLDEAIADYNTALQLNPAEAVFYSNRGALLSLLRKHHEALIDFNKALLLAPRKPVPYYERGLIYYHQGKLNEAMADFKMALELDPANEEYNKRLEFSYQAIELVQRLSEIDNADERKNLAKTEGAELDQNLVAILLSKADERYEQRKRYQSGFFSPQHHQGRHEQFEGNYESKKMR